MCSVYEFSVLGFHEASSLVVTINSVIKSSHPMRRSSDFDIREGSSSE